MTNPAQVKLFQDNLPWASTLAKLVHKTLPPSFDVNDLIQIAWIELWKRVELYNGSMTDTAKFRGYAHIYVRSACRMASRRNHYREATHEGLEIEESDTTAEKGAVRSRTNNQPSDRNPVDERPDPHEEMELQDTAYTAMMADWSRKMTFQRRLKKLNPQQQKLVGYMLAGESHEDIAKRFRISKRAVGCRVSQVIRALKKG